MPLSAFCGARICRHALSPHAPIFSFRSATRTSPTSIRVFTSSRSWCKQDANIKPAVSQPAVAESVKPENVQKPKAVAPSPQSTLLAEANLSNKDQRKADWAIIKDMAHYLWPKNDFGTRFRVGLSVALLVGAKVASAVLSITHVTIKLMSE